jgi:hypothetical protein
MTFFLDDSGAAKAKNVNARRMSAPKDVKDMKRNGFVWIHGGKRDTPLVPYAQRLRTFLS